MDMFLKIFEYEINNFHYSDLRLTGFNSVFLYHSCKKSLGP